MRDHVHRMIEQATPTAHGIGIDDGRDAVSRLASEAIRLAHLAAATHMILAAVPTDANKAEPGEPSSGGGRSR